VRADVSIAFGGSTFEVELKIPASGMPPSGILNAFSFSGSRIETVEEVLRGVDGIEYPAGARRCRAARTPWSPTSHSSTTAGSPAPVGSS